MTEAEFTKFTKRLFTNYPSLHGWLKHNSPDPEGTLRHWHRQLADYSYTECLGVLAEWEKSTSDPFGYNSRDMAALLIRAVIDNHRMKDRRRVEVARMRDAARRTRMGEGVSFGEAIIERVGFRGKEAIEILGPIQAKIKTGEITPAEYEQKKESVFAELGITQAYASTEA